jgi:hypothetical protein
MSVHNLLSYLVGWGELVLKWIDRREAEEEVDFPETGFKWNELGRLAQKFYSDYEDMDFDALRNRLDKVAAEILFVIEKKSNVELYEQNWYMQFTLGRMIQLNTSSPYRNARSRLQVWKKRNLSKKKSSHS